MTDAESARPQQDSAVEREAGAARKPAAEPRSKSQREPGVLPEVASKPGAEPDLESRQAESGAESRPEPDARPESASQPKTGGQRRPTGAALLLVAAAACLWGSSRMVWVTLVSSDGLTEPRTHKIDGGTWFGAMTPLALVLLAAVAAVYATKGWLRRGVGVVVAVLAAVAAVPWWAIVSGHNATADRAAKLAELPVRAQVDHVSTSAFPVWLSLAGALAAFAAGLLLTRMPQREPQLSSKYDNPVFRRADAAGRVAAAADSAVPEGDSGLTERVLWDALDAGADPTAGSAADEQAEPGSGPGQDSGPSSRER